MEIKPSEISLKKSLVPVVLLISLLFYNIIFFENNDWLGDYTYHYILIFTSSLAAILGISEGAKINFIIKKIFSIHSMNFILKIITEKYIDISS